MITLINLKIYFNVYLKEHFNIFVSLGTQRDAKTTKDCIQIQVSLLMHVVCVCVCVIMVKSFIGKEYLEVMQYAHGM